MQEFLKLEIHKFKSRDFKSLGYMLLQIFNITYIIHKLML